jgi:cold shock CspA family protein
MFQIPFMNSWKRNGIVQWFDTKKGVGFIDGTDGEKYFVHHSKISADKCKFKYLKKGEHVEFDVKGYFKKGDNSKYVAANVTGFETHLLDCIYVQRKKIENKIKNTINKEEWTIVENQ